ncbi:MAG: hypothetical protein IKI85_06310 [Bacteroidales bacterium]|nr:hypothetical protein [Bacteroidales bacterium]
MKKLLIPLLCSLFAAWSCHLDSSYYAENVPDIVTVTEHRLINDNGVVYTLAEKSSENLPDLEEDKRYYIVFDILNQAFQIRLHSVIPVEIKVPEELPENTEGLGGDPIQVQFAQYGRRYMDLGINCYFAAGSDYARQLKFYYTLENADSQLNIHLYNDGNNENPAKMDEKDLKIQSHIISIPMAKWESITEVNLSCDVLTKDATTGEFTITRRNYQLR